MKFFFAGNLIFLFTVVQSFPFSRPSDTESRAHIDASASSSGEGIEGLRKFGIGCSGNAGFPDGPDGHDMPGGSFRRGHGDGGGPPFMTGDEFDATSVALAGTDAFAQGGGGGGPFMMGNRFDGFSMGAANANAGAGANEGSHFLTSGVSGALGSATASANAAAGIDAGPASAQSVAQTKSDTISTGNGVISSATSFSSSSAT
ncbi:GPI-anchored CFEM domain protein A-like isoform X2 [Belonocnema kinseyi]|uniref:GPI-anchored CFEM domain protein A-like isoform X2 n=1 Tax=Belonocnema kinseyi TaxID=2817044 RepID=UPI00143D88E7|nr:GPI-anchored CFEM domain protein A-like isoform X2 [Belonocnema kinseyi]